MEQWVTDGIVGDEASCYSSHCTSLHAWSTDSCPISVWIVSVATISWQQGIATPSPTDCCSRARSARLLTAAPPPFAWYARPPVSHYSHGSRNLWFRA